MSRHYATLSICIYASSDEMNASSPYEMMRLLLISQSIPKILIINKVCRQGWGGNHQCYLSANTYKSIHPKDNAPKHSM